MSNKKFLFAFLIAVCSNLFSQSVDSLVVEAVMNNPYLKSLQNKIKASEFRSESINNLNPPNISIEFTDIPFGEKDFYNKSLSNNISISQMFPVGGKLSAMSEVENRNTKIEINNYDSYKKNLIMQVKVQYYSQWLLERKIEIQKKNILLLNELMKAIESKFYTGKINQADLLLIKSEITINESQQLILEKQKEVELYKLNKLLGRELDSKEIIIEKEISSDTLQFSQSELEEILLESNPNLKKMNSMIEMNKAMIIANNKELIPDLMLQAMIMRMPQGMILTSNIPVHNIQATNETEFMYSVMASISLPFAPWSINKFKAKEEELNAGIKSIEYEKSDMQREMISKLKELLVKFNTSFDLIKLYNEKIIPLNTQTIELQISAYQNNRANISNVLESFKMLLMQEMNLFMAKTDLQMLKAEIEMMIGKREKMENGR